ncbi:MAG: hypothetical protein NVSMB65_06890 [Chloroflexota bacterium]
MLTHLRARAGLCALLAACLLSTLSPLSAAAHPAPSPAAGHGVAARGSALIPPALYDVSCPSARTCYVVGYHGTIYGTADGGRSWTQENARTTWGLRGITCLSASTCWAVGWADTILLTRDGGHTWSSHGGLTSLNLSRIVCPRALTCLAVGEFGRILITTTGGRAWYSPTTPLAAGATLSLEGIACPSARTCFVVGGGGTILVTHDGGHAWQQQTTPLAGGAGPLAGVACTSERACVVVGGLGGTTSTILTTGDGGATWVPRPSPVRWALSDVSCPTSRVCYAVGGMGTVLMSSDGGATWMAQDLNTSTGLTGVSCRGTTFCVVVGDNGFISVLSPRHPRSTAPAGPVALTITGTSVYYMMDGPEYRSDIPLQTPAYFAAFYSATNAGTSTPAGRITILKGGRVIGTGTMVAGRNRLGATYLQAGLRFTSPSLLGPLSARMTLTLGKATATTTVRFTVVTNPTLPREAPTPSTQPTAVPTSTTGGSQAGGGQQGCKAWNVAGTWAFAASPTSLIGSGTGSATLTQAGNMVGGTVAVGGVTWTLAGTIQGHALTVTWTAAGQISQSDSATVSGDGTTISGNFGTFSGHATCNG